MKKGVFLSKAELSTDAAGSPKLSPTQIPAGEVPQSLIQKSDSLLQGSEYIYPYINSEVEPLEPRGLEEEKSSELEHPGIAYRIFELTLSLSILFLLSPLLVFVSIRILLEDSGPVFHRQLRVGKKGQTFTIFKFRTMHLNAEQNGPVICTDYEDPRITKFGKFLRKAKIDELPQFFNVIKGEMTLVGPRPERPYFHKQFSKFKDWEKRILVKPGITGPAQLSLSVGHDPEKKIISDIEYIQNKSFLLDLNIIYLTALVALGIMPGTK